MNLSQLVKVVISALEDVKALDINILDVTKMTTLFDRMIIASAVSTRQAKAIANHVHNKVKAAGGIVYGTEGEDAGEWMLVDLGDILVHIMLPAVRKHYDLESLWGELGSGISEQKQTDVDQSRGSAPGSDRIPVN